MESAIQFCTVKPVLSGHSKRRPKISFQDQLSLILMHLQMQRNVGLDNVINLQQYILRYTVGNQTSLHNVSFHWLTGEYMQLASGFMQLVSLDV